MSVRVDKWLWAARFFKTRTLASEAVKGGHVELNGVSSKPSKMVQTGDVLKIQRGDDQFTITVLALAEKRGSASVAQSLYAESDVSIQARARAQQQRKDGAMGSPAPDRRPDKKSRRHIIRFKSSF